MRWLSPISLKLVQSSDSMSFQTMPFGSTALPLLPHPGAFSAVRKHHIHEGVDLYCEVGTPVYAVEDGKVTAVIPFTGPQVQMDWWMDTDAVIVEGASGAVLYGEIKPLVKVGETIIRGQKVGTVLQVLTKDKGRPMAMLHLELHTPGTTEAFEWTQWNENGRPASLLDPTPLLQWAVPRFVHDGRSANCNCDVCWEKFRQNVLR